MGPTGKSINVGLIGLGVVGEGVASALLERGNLFMQHTGCSVNIAGIAVRDPQKVRPAHIPNHLLSTDPSIILDDPEIQIIVELIGGEQPAYDYIVRALTAGKSVVTANKEVLAKHGPVLLELARNNGSHLLFEASVGGGIPILRPLLTDLRANFISDVRAIINGTTNYILTKMTYEAMNLADALSEAQSLGYAESDPTNDVEGIDASYKISILSSLAFRTRVDINGVHTQGITTLEPKDFIYANDLGYTIKLIAIARYNGGVVEARVHPTLIPSDSPLAKVDGVLNAIEITGDLLGKVVFQGSGAGSLPTTSAVISDILEVANNIQRGADMNNMLVQEDSSMRPIGDVISRYYIRATVSDRPGVLAQMASVLGQKQISIASVMQKESDPQYNTAELVITTHKSKESDFQEALKQLEMLDVVIEIGQYLRVED